MGEERWKKHKGISLLNVWFKLYSESSNENLKAKAENLLSECHNGLHKHRSCIDPLFSVELL